MLPAPMIEPRPMCHSLQHDGIEADPDVVADHDGLCPDAVDPRRMATLDDLDEVRMTLGRVARMAVGVVHIHAVRNQHAIADPHRGGRPDP